MHASLDGPRFLVSAPLTRRRVLGLLAAAAAGALTPGCAASGRTKASAEDEPDFEAFLALVGEGDSGAVERMLDRDARLV